jgi:hypothetical protein
MQRRKATSIFGKLGTRRQTCCSFLVYPLVLTPCPDSSICSSHFLHHPSSPPESRQYISSRPKQDQHQHHQKSHNVLLHLTSSRRATDTGPVETNRYYLIFVILSLVLISLIQPSGRILDSSIVDSVWLRASPLARLVDMGCLLSRIVNRAMQDSEQRGIPFYYKSVLADRYLKKRHQGPQDHDNNPLLYPKVPLSNFHVCT